jgi:hypothetical protein
MHLVSITISAASYAQDFIAFDPPCEQECALGEKANMKDYFFITRRNPSHH